MRTFKRRPPLLALAALWGCASTEYVPHPALENARPFDPPVTLVGFSMAKGGSCMRNGLAPLIDTTKATMFLKSELDASGVFPNVELATAADQAAAGSLIIEPRMLEFGSAGKSEWDERTIETTRYLKVRWKAYFEGGGRTVYADTTTHTLPITGFSTGARTKACYALAKESFSEFRANLIAALGGAARSEPRASKAGEPSAEDILEAIAD